MRTLGVLSLLLACKEEDAPLRGCDVSEGGIHTCSQLLSGAPSIACSARGGQELAQCAEDGSVRCDAETEDGTYRLFGYGDLQQATLDAQCDDLRRSVAAQRKADAEDGDCTWSLEGDEASELGSVSGTCSLNAATRNALAFRDLGLGRAASISKLEIGVEVFGVPIILTPQNMSGNGFLQQFQLSLIGRVQQAEVTRNWYCSWNGRTEPRGTFRIHIKRFDIQDDGKVSRYEGSVDAECPAAAAPAAGTLRVHVEFKGSL